MGAAQSGFLSLTFTATTSTVLIAHLPAPVPEYTAAQPLHLAQPLTQNSPAPKNFVL